MGAGQMILVSKHDNLRLISKAYTGIGKNWFRPPSSDFHVYTNKPHTHTTRTHTKCGAFVKQEMNNRIIRKWTSLEKDVYAGEIKR